LLANKDLRCLKKVFIILEGYLFLVLALKKRLNNSKKQESVLVVSSAADMSAFNKEIYKANIV
jgi:hypothetical protein